MIKTKTEWKVENPLTVLERRTLCFSSYCKLKVKLWWAGARERKARGFCVPFILSERNFFNICDLAQCSIVYWTDFRNICFFTYQKHYFIHDFQNICFFTYQKHYFIHFSCLLLKSSKVFCVPLSRAKD